LFEKSPLFQAFQQQIQPKPDPSSPNQLSLFDL